MSDSHKNLQSKMERRAIKAVLFDLDDTLWPIIPLIHDAEQALYNWLQINAPRITERHSIASMRALRQQLIPTQARFAYDLWALRHAMLTQLLAEELRDANQVDRLADAAMQVFAQARNQVSMYGDVLPGIAALSRQYRLGSISNGFADLAAIGLAQHFQVSLAAHQFGCAKPDPRIFLAACAALEVQPDQAVYVGDDLEIDVRGARQAGLGSVWMNRSGKVAVHQADFECRDLAELQIWLQKSSS